MTCMDRGHRAVETEFCSRIHKLDAKTGLHLNPADEMAVYTWPGERLQNTAAWCSTLIFLLNGHGELMHYQAGEPLC